MEPSHDNMTAKVNIMMTHDQKQELDTLSKRMKLSRSQVLRQALRAMWAWYGCAVPVCASGQRCHVPHMHVIQTDLEPANNCLLPSAEAHHV